MVLKKKYASIKYKTLETIPQLQILHMFCSMLKIVIAKGVVSIYVKGGMEDLRGEHEKKICKDRRKHEFLLLTEENTNILFN